MNFPRRIPTGRALELAIRHLDPETPEQIVARRIEEREEREEREESGFDWRGYAVKLEGDLDAAAREGHRSKNLSLALGILIGALLMTAVKAVRISWSVVDFFAKR